MVPDKRQTMLFSATMPGPIVTLSRSFMTQPTHIRAHGNDEGSTVPQTTQFIYRAHNLDKPELLSRVLQSRDRGLVMVFCRTKRTAQKVADELVDRGFAAAAVHGDLGQGAREQALRAFRSGKVDVLVATDVAARGIDVTGVSHVVNYQCPEDEKTYVHRIGRTGRAGSDRRRRHARRLGRHPPLAADQQGARPRLRRPAGDVLDLAVGLHRPRRADDGDRPPAALAAHPRGPGRRDARGPRRDRQAQPPDAVRRPRGLAPARPRRLPRPVGRARRGRAGAGSGKSRPRRRTRGTGAGAAAEGAAAPAASGVVVRAGLVRGRREPSRVAVVAAAAPTAAAAPSPPPDLPGRRAAARPPAAAGAGLDRGHRGAARRRDPALAGLGRGGHREHDRRTGRRPRGDAGRRRLRGLVGRRRPLPAGTVVAERPGAGRLARTGCARSTRSPARRPGTTRAATPGCAG